MSLRIHDYNLFASDFEELKELLVGIGKMRQLLLFRFGPILYGEYICSKKFRPLHIKIIDIIRSRRSVITLIIKLKMSKLSHLWRKEILWEISYFFAWKTILLFHKIYIHIFFFTLFPKFINLLQHIFISRNILIGKSDTAGMKIFMH